MLLTMDSLERLYEHEDNLQAIHDCFKGGVQDTPEEKFLLRCHTGTYGAREMCECLGKTAPVLIDKWNYFICET